MGTWRETVISQNGWPDRILGIRELRDDPEAKIWMVDEGNGFVGSGSHRPGFAEEVQSVIGVEFALEIDGQMQI